MNTKRFTLTEEEQKELRQCPQVRRVSARMVQYTANFKRHAVREHARGMSPYSIFKDAGIPYYFRPDYAADCLKEWVRLVTRHGVTHFDTETRGRGGTAHMMHHKDIGDAYKTMTDAEKIAYLEARTEALEYIARHFGLPPSPSLLHSSRRRKK